MKSKLLDIRGWSMMLKLGYQSGKDLGAHLQGRTKLVPNYKMRDRRGLGYRESPFSLMLDWLPLT